MKRIRLQVAILPWIEPGSQSSSNGQQREGPLKPWLHVCSEEITLQELAEQIVSKFARIYAGLGDLTIRHLESDYGEILDLGDTVGDVFDDRAPSGESRTSIVRVAGFVPDSYKLKQSARFGSLMPESSARPTKRSFEHFSPALVAVPTTEFQSSQGSSTTVGRVVKRQKRNGSINSTNIDDLDLGGVPLPLHIGTDEVSVQVRGSQQLPRWYSPDLFGTPSSHPRQRMTLSQNLDGTPTPIRGNNVPRNLYGTPTRNSHMRQKTPSTGYDSSPPRPTQTYHGGQQSQVVIAETSPLEDPRSKDHNSSQFSEPHAMHVQPQDTNARFSSPPRSPSQHSSSTFPVDENLNHNSKNLDLSHEEFDLSPDPALLNKVSGTRNDVAPSPNLDQKRVSDASSIQIEKVREESPSLGGHPIETSGADAESRKGIVDIRASIDVEEDDDETEDETEDEENPDAETHPRTGIVEDRTGADVEESSDETEDTEMSDVKNQPRTEIVDVRAGGDIEEDDDETEDQGMPDVKIQSTTGVFDMGTGGDIKDDGHGVGDKERRDVNIQSKTSTVDVGAGANIEEDDDKTEDEEDEEDGQPRELVEQEVIEEDKSLSLNNVDDDKENVEPTASDAEDGRQASQSDKATQQHMQDGQGWIQATKSKRLEGKSAAESYLAGWLAAINPEEESTPRPKAGPTMETISTTTPNCAVDLASTANLDSVPNVTSNSNSYLHPKSRTTSTTSLESMSDVPSQAPTDSDPDSDSASDSESKPSTDGSGSPAPLVGERTLAERLYFRSVLPSNELFFGFDLTSKSRVTSTSNSTPDKTRYPKFSALNSSPDKSAPQKDLSQGSPKATPAVHSSQDDLDDSESESELSGDSGDGKWQSGMRGLHKLAKLGERAKLTEQLARVQSPRKSKPPRV